MLGSNRMRSVQYISIDIYVYTCIEHGFRPDPTSQLGNALSSKFGHRELCDSLPTPLHGQPRHRSHAFRILSASDTLMIFQTDFNGPRITPLWEIRPFSIQTPKIEHIYLPLRDLFLSLNKKTFMKDSRFTSSLFFSSQELFYLCNILLEK